MLSSTAKRCIRSTIISSSKSRYFPSFQNVAFRKFSAEVEVNSPSSFPTEKMETDKRYQTTTEIPESLKGNQQDGEFSIRGKFRKGRAVYLDMSATTPMDPRVLDSMLPHMVSQVHF